MWLSRSKLRHRGQESLDLTPGSHGDGSAWVSRPVQWGSILATWVGATVAAESEHLLKSEAFGSGWL